MEIKTGLHGVDEAMRERVRGVLKEIEAEHDVRVLFACESGSRGWGFASPDSDYDVRFLYVHKPEWYLRVEASRDVIEKPIDDELDVCGWEWRKALGLLKRANPTLIDWLDSPVVYRQESNVMARLNTLSGRFFSADRARWHYKAMAAKNFRQYLQEEEVRLKKYFYVLRPLLAVRWIEERNGAPPMRFDQLVRGTVSDTRLLRDIEELLTIKQRSGEAQYGSRREVLHAFIEAELTRDEILLPAAHDKSADALLDRLLFETVMNVENE
ncbi:putative nucleotidyltransferase [Pantoea sp. AS-PWVM4]|uniref:Nucleotidyltransferase domain-containing protein n=1 Tax=Pantoea phytobeneficialis TaxID=2052056 RepID=A0AAP9HAN9_9GAMM|nr:MULTISPECIES: nucleotidyltransferase domain-containing protein [Pantoea]ERK06185.1 putative nucleotidyltransferase [Pantoea sp. AS-PWVM4]MDO6406524.1 nucleotidyltransferase domain-containing protein [Pantoea phytobeneficialis]QGR09621.1 nucleotidyltransferase domain-containing protein [Pantoea phytobeneficialis]